MGEQAQAAGSHCVLSVCSYGVCLSPSEALSSLPTFYHESARRLRFRTFDREDQVVIYHGDYRQITDHVRANQGAYLIARYTVRHSLPIAALALTALLFQFFGRKDLPQEWLQQLQNVHEASACARALLLTV